MVLVKLSPLLPRRLDRVTLVPIGLISVISRSPSNVCVMFDLHGEVRDVAHAADDEVASNATVPVGDRLADVGGVERSAGVVEDAVVVEILEDARPTDGRFADVLRAVAVVVAIDEAVMPHGSVMPKLSPVNTSAALVTLADYEPSPPGNVRRRPAGVTTRTT